MFTWLLFAWPATENRLKERKGISGQNLLLKLESECTPLEVWLGAICIQGERAAIWVGRPLPLPLSPTLLVPEGLDKCLIGMTDRVEFSVVLGILYFYFGYTKEKEVRGGKWRKFIILHISVL